jgi:hypothetical protein
MKLASAAAIAAGAIGFARPVFAHDTWASGEPVPAWVKRACCGPDDVHHLRKEQVRLEVDGWHVDGYPDVIPAGTEQPSPDGEYWIFYRTNTRADGSTYQTRVYCFFVPPTSF